MTIIDQVIAQKRKLERAEAERDAELASERVALRKLMTRALAERYRKADLARAMGVSPSRAGELLRSAPARKRKQ